MEVRVVCSNSVLMAEVIYNFLPRLVDMHNYSAQHSVEKKIYNWQTLNCKWMWFVEKVFKKMGFSLTKTDMENIVKCAPDAIEKVLRLVQSKLVTLKDGFKSPKPKERVVAQAPIAQVPQQRSLQA